MHLKFERLSSVERIRFRAETCVAWPHQRSILCPIVKFGSSRGLVSRHLLGVFESSVVLQVNRDAGCPLGVTSDRGEKIREANFADRFGVSRSTLYRNAAGPESPKMLMMGSQTERHGHPGGHDGRRLGPRAAGPG